MNNFMKKIVLSLILIIYTIYGFSQTYKCNKVTYGYNNSIKSKKVNLEITFLLNKKIYINNKIQSEFILFNTINKFENKSYSQITIFAKDNFYNNCNIIIKIFNDTKKQIITIKYNNCFIEYWIK